MIKLVLNPDQDATEQTFSNGAIRIGSPAQEGPEKALDWVLPPDVPESTLLNITLEGRNYIVTNVNSTPELSLNGELFSSAPINSGDRLQCGTAEVLFESEPGVELSDDEISSMLETIEAEGSADTDGEESDVEDFDIDDELAKLSGLFDSEELAVEEDEFHVDDDEIEKLLESTDIFEEPAEEVKAEDASPDDTSDSVEAGESPTETPLETATNDFEGVDDDALFAFDDDDSDVELEVNEDDDVDDKLSQKIDETPNQRWIEEEEPVSSITSAQNNDDPLLKQSVESMGDTQQWSAIDDEADDEEHSGESREEFDAFQLSSQEPDEKTDQQATALSKGWLLVAGVVLVMALIGFGGTSYLRSQHYLEEKQGAIGVADLSMALMHAYVRQIQPYDSNLLDADFIEENLQGVLGGAYLAESPLRTAELLESLNYTIHARSTEDLSRFLIIAEPHSSWLSWLAPKATLFINSSNMELRRTHHPQSLLELSLAHASLDTVEDEQVYAATIGSEPVRLGSLDGTSPQMGFSLPKDLAYLLPEASSRIYNAPRYYKLTEPLLERTQESVAGRLSKREKNILTNIFGRLSLYPYLVMYTSKGPEAAEKAEKALAVELRGYSIIVGHVTLETGQEWIADANLRLDDDAVFTEYIENQAQFSPPPSNEMAPAQTVQVDPHHPLYITLTELSKQRQDALQSISDRIMTLMQEHNIRNLPYFDDRHQELTDEYRKASQSYKTKISRVLSKLHTDYSRENSGSQLALFLATVKATELDSLLPAELNIPLQQDPKSSSSSDSSGSHSSDYSDQVNEQTFTTLIEQVEAGDSLKSLARVVAQTKNFLAQPSVDTDQRLRFSNELRSKVLRKIGNFLLSPAHETAPQTFQEQNRGLLTQILNDSGVSDLDERNFYLSEFDILMNKFRSISQHTLQELQDIDDKIVRELEVEDVDVSYRQLMEEKHAQNQAQIAEQRESIKNVKERLGRLPLNTATTSPDKQQGNLSRLGQQILIQESLNPPGPSRDDKLLEAIGLLTQGTESNRSLWEDILEARRLITETPKEGLLRILRSDLGFEPSRGSIPSDIRNTLSSYISEQQTLVGTQNKDHYLALYKIFKQKNEGKLEDVIDKTELIGRECNTLTSLMESYIQRLKEFEADYRRARAEGFFSQNRRYHSIMSSRLERKLERAQRLRGQLSQVCGDLMAASSRHRSLAQEELRKLREDEYITADTSSLLQQESNAITYPNLVSDSIGEKIEEMAKIGVYPVSQ